MNRVFNFSAGPSTLPDAVVEQAQAELPDWQGLGCSVMEVSHRGKPFVALAERCEAALRRLMGIPESYAVLFLAGGAQTQFAAVPLNLASARGRLAGYVNTGSWSTKAIGEARRFTAVHVAATSEADGFRHVPPRAEWDVNRDCVYLHYTPNETIGGVEFHWTPEVGDIPLVADMSSMILSRPVDVSQHGLIYAGAQKNAGISGITLVIVRRDLLGGADPKTPSTIDYAVQTRQRSMANTPATFPWYITSLVFDWLEREGGVEEMARRNARKAEKIYAAIDGSSFFSNPVALADRSFMNVTFFLADPALDGQFLTRAEEAGLVGLKGHRSVGGMRASLYNAMPEAGADRLVEVMREFERARA